MWLACGLVLKFTTCRATRWQAAAVVHLPASRIKRHRRRQRRKSLDGRGKKRFPPGLDYAVALDTTLPVTEGIVEIQHTFIEAVILVIL